MNINFESLEKYALELCYEIEKIPTSEEQTAAAIKAAALHEEIKKIIEPKP